MEPKILKNDEDYRDAIRELELIGDGVDFETNQSQIDRFELFSKLISDYENAKFPIKEGDPIEIIKLKMNFLQLTSKDLEQYIGSKGTVSEVLNRKRGLSKNMIRKLSEGLNIDQKILNTPYILENKLDISSSDTHEPCFNLSNEVRDRARRFGESVKNRGMVLALCPN